MIRKWWHTFEAWIGLFFIIRLYGIWYPPLETWHSWRQTLTAMMARNMSEGSFAMLYPQIDMGGTRTGIIGAEFPLLQALIASLNKTFGYQHWYGRLIVLIAASFGVYATYLLVKRFWNERIARNTGFVLLVSLWFSFSRKIMPDTFAVSLVLIGFWWMVRYVDTKRTLFWLGATGMLALGGLSKIPSIFLFACIIPVLFNRNIAFSLRFHVLLGTGLATVMVAWWYFVWVPFLVKTYHFELFFPKSISEGLAEIQPLWFDFWKQIYFGGLRSYIGLAAVVLGILALIRGNRSLAAAIGLSCVVFLIFAIKTGTVFPTHNYYVLPLVPILALLAGLGLNYFPKKWTVGLLVIIAAEGIGNQVSDFRIKEEVRYKLTLESQVDSVLDEAEKVVILSGPDPQLTYWLHRKTWSIDRSELEVPHMLQSFKSGGFQYIVLDRRADQALPNWLPAYTTPDCWIYRIP